MSTVTADNNHHDDHHHFDGSKNVFGFWIYIMSDCVLFATLFAVYAVFHKHTFGGADAQELFSLPYVFVETMLLLVSSFTFGLAMLNRNSDNINHVIKFLWVTFFLGLGFIIMEVHEFYELAMEGHTWASSAFLSSFFTLVGTHGLHVSMGLIWIVSMIFQLKKHGMTPMTKTKMTYLGLFWHFLDIVWIFVFSIVYLLGAV
ncbi:MULTISPECIES: cytochrome o ubiquinol oxidase subunit III [Francisella]|uniref:Cytochrome bo(3) ubiquinol oxidase subunit 3 n=1 Tax=Francisella adeliensis TaxID=2007306 RepID=A0A2Z4Y012_9GAMM|nr:MULTISPECIES: cytochrome o ubiquinol oxidase subunit III [Francisella]AXA34487.1 cytochrome o ubiquinol oxidase subunit III [Francisella adeliensis]MBK2086206.1 cytochrome o ubiquinol oxidase subunit III [Francisella adeliensis]MBK2096423.1 cytochrome o ubiquinol oxidase subunit III [Francisella adeliensis]QIW12735.1 cytochrome o ubiquinol oxidase subunit III [Francisella adeliensis]QIW14611.1 cytochrome o ubiquinol oxidase subunit III [Francisella adeliensis]